MKALVGAFNQEKALVGAFSVIVQLHRPINRFAALPVVLPHQHGVEAGQPRVVVDPLVARPEALAGPSLQPAVRVILVLGQEVAAVHLNNGD